MKINVELEIKKSIIKTHIEMYGDIELPSDEDLIEFYNENKYEMYDAVEEFRCGGEETNLGVETYSRHFESYRVAKKLECGVWVSWIYWYGGGKHAEPDMIDWIEDAYQVNCEEKEIVKIERTFSKSEVI